jgi:hypothetical protein
MKPFYYIFNTKKYNRKHIQIYSPIHSNGLEIHLLYCLLLVLLLFTVTTIQKFQYRPFVGVQVIQYRPFVGVQVIQYRPFVGAQYFPITKKQEPQEILTKMVSSHQHPPKGW